MHVAVITGGSSGIGQAAAFELAKRGTAVVVTYRGSRERGLETVERIEKDGGTAVVLPLDVGRPDTFTEFRTALTDVLQQWGRTSFDFLVSNAGVGQPPVMFEDTTVDLFDQMVNVHLKGPYFLTQTLLPLIADHGSIVYTTAVRRRLGHGVVDENGPAALGEQFVVVMPAGRTDRLGDGRVELSHRTVVPRENLVQAHDARDAGNT